MRVNDTDRQARTSSRPPAKPVIETTLHRQPESHGRSRGNAPPIHELELKAVVETMVDAVVMIDRDGTILRANPAAERMFGYADRELLGRNVNVLMPAPFQHEHAGYLEHYRRTGEARVIGSNCEVVARRKDGSVFPIRLSVSEVGHLNVYVGLIHDLSDWKRAEAQLREAERLAAIGGLAAGLAHDITNIVTLMNLSLGRIDSHRLPEDMVESVDAAREAVSSLAALCNSLRGVVRSGADDSRRSVLLHEWWKRQETLMRVASMPGIVINAELSEPLPAVSGNEHQLSRAVLNLVMNAVEAIVDSEQRHGKVTVWASHQRGAPFVQLGVRDDGPGIPPHIRERIFEPFFSTKANRPSTGMGLSMVRSMLEDIGGAVTVHSTEGAGTDFVLHLPLANAQQT